MITTVMNNDYNKWKAMSGYLFLRSKKVGLNHLKFQLFLYTVPWKAGSCVLVLRPISIEGSGFHTLLSGLQIIRHMNKHLCRPKSKIMWTNPMALCCVGVPHALLWVKPCTSSPFFPKLTLWRSCGHLVPILIFWTDNRGETLVLIDFGA